MAVVGPLDNRGPYGGTALKDIDALVAEGLYEKAIASVGSTGDMQHIKEATLVLSGVAGEFCAVLGAVLCDKHGCSLFTDKGELVVVGVDVELLIGSAAIGVDD